MVCFILNQKNNDKKQKIVYNYRMSRIARKHQLENNLFFHVFNRANAKLEIFHHDTDYEYFLSLIKRYKKKYMFNLFHWVLLPNHFHFSIEMADQENIIKCIGGLQQAYTQYHHKKWNSAGKLWQGRFKSLPVEKERYLLDCGRYIEMNPVRAGIVEYPWEYKWSSCSVYLTGEEDGITKIDPGYISLGRDVSGRGEKYKIWLMKEDQINIENNKKYFGSRNFRNKLVSKKGRLLARRRGRPLKG